MLEDKKRFSFFFYNSGVTTDDKQLMIKQFGV